MDERRTLRRLASLERKVQDQAGQIAQFVHLHGVLADRLVETELALLEARALLDLETPDPTPRPCLAAVDGRRVDGEVDRS